MTAPNHAVSGALIGLAFGNPFVALPLAFVFHFALDAVPHYDAPGADEGTRIGSQRFRRQLIAEASLCLVLVALLAAFRPHAWLVAVLAAFMCAAPDLFWIPKFLHAQRTGQTLPNMNWFLRLHHEVQWKTGPELWWIEAAWLVVYGSIFAACL